MGEVGGGEAIEAQGNAVAAQDADAPESISFADADAGDREASILDEVLAGGDADASTEGTQEVETKEGGEVTPPPAAAKTPEPAPDVAEGAQLRRGFAKLAEDRQKLVEQQNALRQERAAVQQYATKAEAHDKLVARLREDPAGVIAELGDELVNKTLQGFIDREKSPADRRLDAMERERKQDKEKAERAEMERVAAQWRADTMAKIQADERFDLVNSLGLHNDVIDVITGYYDKHSERDEKGNVTVPAILDWAIAAQAVEEHREAMLGKSKRYGKRAPAAETPVTGKKDTPAAKNPQGSAKKPTTSLSSVPMSDGPSREEELPTDDLDERERRVMASLGF